MKSRESSRFLADSPGIGGEIREPEDFVVEEVADDKLLRKYIIIDGKVTPIEGKFVLVLMKKRLLTTEEAIARLKQKFHCNVGYAGMKDKFAVTYQHITIPRDRESFLYTFRDKDIGLQKIGYTDRDINLGDLSGNNFTITLHGAKVTKIFDELKVFPNYFGPQRFGAGGKNVEIGRHIIKGKYNKALKEINQMYKTGFRDIKEVEKTRLKFFVHAYQSFLFNDMLSRGHQAVIPGYSCLPAFLKKEENITKENFRKQDLRISFAGGPRDMFVQPNIIYTKEEDKMILKFFLPKGSYATTILHEIMKKDGLHAGKDG